MIPKIDSQNVFKEAKLQVQRQLMYRQSDDDVFPWIMVSQAKSNDLYIIKGIGYKITLTPFFIGSKGLLYKIWRSI